MFWLARDRLSVYPRNFETKINGVPAPPDPGWAAFDCRVIMGDI